MAYTFKSKTFYVIKIYYIIYNNVYMCINYYIKWRKLILWQVIKIRLGQIFKYVTEWQPINVLHEVKLSIKFSETMWNICCCFFFPSVKQKWQQLKYFLFFQNTFTPEYILFATSLPLSTFINYIRLITFHICTYIFLLISKPRRSAGECSYFLMC